MGPSGAIQHLADVEREARQKRGRFRRARRERHSAWREWRQGRGHGGALIWSFNAGVIWGLGKKPAAARGEESNPSGGSSDNDTDLTTVFFRAVTVGRLIQSLVTSPPAAD